MDDRKFSTLKTLGNLILGRQRDLIEACGGYKRVMDLTGKSKSEVGRWNGGIDQDFMPFLVVCLLEGDCGRPLITTAMAEANGRRLTDPEEERQSEINLHRAYAETVRKRADVDLAYAAAIEDGHVSDTEATLISRALSANERANFDMQGAVSVIKAHGKAKPRLVSGE